MSGYANSATPSDAAGADQEVVGNVASGAADSGNPVKVAGINSTTLPTLTDGQRGNLQIGTRGSLHVAIYAPDSATGISAQSTSADGVATSGGSLRSSANAFAFNGTTWDRLRGNTSGLIVIPPDNSWSYAAASGGIDNSNTAVTIKAAAGAGVRNYLQSLQVQTATLGAATELAIRDGAAGTVLWRTQLQTTAMPLVTVNFDPPLKGTANTLLEVITLTAVTGDVMINAQGYLAP